MDLTDILEEARQIHDDVAEDLGDTCRIERLGKAEFDRESGETVRPVVETLHDGPCRLPVPGGGIPQVTQSGELATPISPVVRVPATVTGIEPDDRVTITASPGDPDLVGDVLWVSHVRQRSLNASRLLDCRTAE